FGNYVKAPRLYPGSVLVSSNLSKAWSTCVQHHLISLDCLLAFFCFSIHPFNLVSDCLFWSLYVFTIEHDAGLDGASQAKLASADERKGVFLHASFWLSRSRFTPFWIRRDPRWMDRS